MTAWIVSIVGVVALGVLVEIMLPEGETAKYIKGIFGIIVVFVIVAPLPKLLGKNGEIRLPEGGSAVTEDAAYMGRVYDRRAEQLEARAAALCRSYGVTCEEAEIIRGEGAEIASVRLRVGAFPEGKSREELTRMIAKLLNTEEVTFDEYGNR